MMPGRLPEQRPEVASAAVEREMSPVASEGGVATRPAKSRPSGADRAIRFADRFRVTAFWLATLASAHHVSAQTPPPPPSPPPVADSPAIRPPAVRPPAIRPPEFRPPGGRLPAAPAVPGRAGAALQTMTLAITGQPYGVARIELPLAEPTRESLLAPLEITDSENRIFYPVTRDVQVIPGQRPRQIDPPGAQVIGGGRLIRRIGDMVRELTADAEPMTVSREVTFLFRGDQPLRVQLSVPDVAGRTELLLTPTPAPIANTHAQVMAQWWAAYTAALQRQTDQGDYPPIVESYLVALLSGRLDLPLPADFLADPTTQEASMLSTLNLIAGTEAIRMSILRRAATGVDGEAEIASLPLPDGPRWQPTEMDAQVMNTAEGAADVNIEPTATRVPPECFYLRFGSFANYIWFRDLSEEHGGDISRMVTLRGIENNSARRLENQLCLKTTELSRMLGESVIEDQAIVGRDLFLTDGASLGVLFRARNAFLLIRSLEGDRAAVVNGDPEVTQSTVTIEGQNVSLLASPDNRIRSFMASDGEYVFVSNSETLIKRFFQVGRDGDSLAKTPEFRLARRLMPADRGDSVFAFVSPQMLRGLVAPEYMIEMRRRLQSGADMALLRLARLASAAESQPLSEIDDLVDAGFLPLGFGSRPDGSGLIAVGDRIVDSLRGSSGTLLPIADVSISAVTEEESRWYRTIADYHNTQWRQMDPIMAALRRSSDPATPGIERIEGHIEIAPWSPEKYGSIARQLGPPTNVRIDFAPDDIIAGQAHVVSDQLSGSIPPHHLFAAIKDTTPPQPEEFDGILRSYGALRTIPGYVGAWPFPGLLDRLPLGIGRGQPAGPGMTRLIGGIYRFQGGDFSILSFHPEVLEASLPHIAADESDETAQVRVRAGNLVGSRLETWANERLYERSVAASRAGADLLGLLTRQLKVDRDSALDVVGELLGERLQDPLGGQFTLVTDESSLTGQRRWISTAWPGGAVPDTPPADYVAPILSWFRGGQANLTQWDDRVSADVSIDIQRRAKSATARPSAK